MQFKIAAVAIAALSMGQAHAQDNAHADISANVVVGNINHITDISSETDKIAQTINPTNLFATVPKIITNFKTIVSTVTDDINTMGSASATTHFSVHEQSDVCDAFSGFVKVHQALLKTIIGKHGLLSSTPFTAPLAAVLRTLEGGVDTLAYSIIGLVPSCADKAKMELKQLDGTLDQATQTFSFSR